MNTLSHFGAKLVAEELLCRKNKHELNSLAGRMGTKALLRKSFEGMDEALRRVSALAGTCLRALNSILKITLDKV